MTIWDFKSMSYRDEIPCSTFLWCQQNRKTVKKICCSKAVLSFASLFSKQVLILEYMYIHKYTVMLCRLLSNPVLCKAVIWKWKADAGFYYWMWSYVTCINDLLTLLGYVLATLKNFTVEKLSLFYYEMGTNVPHITIF